MGNAAKHQYLSLLKRAARVENGHIFYIFTILAGSLVYESHRV